MGITTVVDIDTVMRVVEWNQAAVDDRGICVACGEITSGVEPDACNYPCPACGESQVYGAEELLFLM